MQLLDHSKKRCVNYRSWKYSMPTLFVLLTVCVVFSLSGCGGGSNDSSSTPSFVISDESIVEGSGGGITKLDFTVTLSVASSSNVRVDYSTSDGTALAASDYIFGNGSLMIPAGDTTGIITVMVITDALFEEDETFTLNLSSPANDTVGIVSATGIILNDDAIPSISIASAFVAEGSDGGATNLDFMVTSSAASSSDITVDYVTSDGTAVAASDYTSGNGSLTITAGSTTGTITVSVNADTDSELNENFTLTLSNPTNATIVTAIVTGIITNDDGLGIPLNDTGITSWSNATINDLTSTEDDFPVQDVDVGRDANSVTNSNADGMAGFSFTKLDAVGQPLADQMATYETTSWDCVQDNVTGLMWEVKTTADEGGLRDANYTYTWYNSTGINGGSSGVINGGKCVNATDCDTEKYVAAVNAAGLCGYTDWYLPDRESLISIVNYSLDSFGQSIDTGYFPNTSSSYYWSASPYAGIASNVWLVFFYAGNDYVSRKSTSNYVRLVRVGQ